MKQAENIDQYIAGFPADLQDRLRQVRTAISQAAPKAEEVISYGMPAFKQGSVLVYFAGYAHHIGFYSSSSGIAEFKDAISKYKWSKGAVQFPHDKPIPITLIKRITAYRLKAVIAKAKARQK